MRDWIIFSALVVLTIILVKALFKTKRKKRNRIPDDGVQRDWWNLF